VESDLNRADTADGDDDQVTLPEGLDLDLVAQSAAGPDLASAYASLELDLPPVPDTRVTEDLAGRADTRQAIPGSGAAADDLIASLPTPRPPVTPTRPLPAKTRPPAFESGAPGATTRDLTLEPTDTSLPAPPPVEAAPYVMKLDPQLAVHPDPQQATAPTRDLSASVSELAGRSGTTPPIDSSLITAPTRELGLRYERRAATEDETTGQVDIHKVRAARSNGRPEILGMDPIDARSAEILEQIDSGAPAIETREERTRRRITALLERAAAWGQDADVERAVTAVDLALSEDPNSALAQKLIHRNRDAIMNAFQAFLGDLQRTPHLARPLHELGSAPISPRAAFLLSRVDGTLSLDEILDVSGMPRLEAYRYLCQLLLRGILR
jgi:hypothetical protein